MSTPRLGARFLKILGLAGWAVAPLVFSAGAAVADNVADFYKGKTVKMVIGYPPGAGYDVHARALVHHVAKHIPGNPTVIAQNMPGAGSLKAANWLYNVAPQDGTVMGAINRSLAMAPLLETVPSKKAKLKFDPLKFHWIGSMDKTIGLGICRKDSGITSFNDFYKREVIQTASSPTSDSTVFPTVLNNMFGTKIRIIGGHQGSRGNYLALERGEAECYLGTSHSSVRTIHPEWLKPNEFIRIVVQLGAEARPDIDAPLVLEFANDEQKQALELLFAPQQMGRPYLAPPGVPGDRVKALRAAFDATMKDPGFLAEAGKTGIDVEPLSGAGIEKLLRRIYKTDPSIVKMLQDAMPKQG